MSNYFGTDPEREGLPGEDDGRVDAVEVHFAIPTWITPEQQQRLVALLNEIVRAPANTPRDGVHWIAGPDLDDRVLYIESSARPR